MPPPDLIEAMARRARNHVDDVEVWVAPIEYVILRKLEWLRQGGPARHAEDIRSMVRVSGERIDHAALAPWLASLRLEPEWSGIQPTSG